VADERHASRWIEPELPEPFVDLLLDLLDPNLIVVEVIDEGATDDAISDVGRQRRADHVSAFLVGKRIEIVARLVSRSDEDKQIVCGLESLVDDVKVGVVKRLKAADEYAHVVWTPPANTRRICNCIVTLTHNLKEERLSLYTFFISDRGCSFNIFRAKAM